MTLVCRETGAFYLSDRLVRAWALRCRGLLYDKAAAVLPGGGAGGRSVLGVVREAMVQIARSKIALDPVSTLTRGVLCNVLVCLAVWLCMGARSVTDKILAIVFPITAFVACGFEHSVANMYFLPIGVALAAGTSAPLSVADAVSNLVLVTIGNVLGGTVLVALVYWSVYLRNSD